MRLRVIVIIFLLTLSISLIGDTSVASSAWTEELEQEWNERVQTILQAYSNIEYYGSNYGENEKKSYPRAMFDLLLGHREKALEFLQSEDSEAKEHAQTEGIDYYYCFTLKGQIRKYFLFGQDLDPNYKQRMFLGAKKWTASDPLKRPHPLYGYGNNQGNDWDIRHRGRWVDGRNTDNLRAMRETSVYLMAEETGNEQTRLLYKQKIKRYVWALYNIGMGEWDSQVYHGHTFTPYLNLYDFAKDPQVKQLAKKALDWLSTAAAIKYYHGAWGGPVKRDYGDANLVFGGLAAKTFWLYFGDNSFKDTEPELDSLYLITSSYRPPLAVVDLARKQFNKPVEIIASKPLYENWKPGNDQQPGYWETQYFGNTYQMGSLVSAFPDGDVAPFKLMANNTQRGVDYFVAATGDNWFKPSKNQSEEIGQYRNLLIWLKSTSSEDFVFQLPKSAKVEIEDNIWFIELEKTWLAIYTINLSLPVITKIPEPNLAQLYKDEESWKSTPLANRYNGFALEVGEANQQISTYKEFKEKVKKKGKLNLTKLDKGEVTLIGSQGNQLKYKYNEQNLLPFIERDRLKYDWIEHLDLYRSINPQAEPVSLGWKKGRLTIKTLKQLYRIVGP